MLYLILQFITEKVPQTIADAFGRLYEELMPRVFRYVNYRVVDVDVAQDLTETIFEKALAKFKTYRVDKSGYSTWIFSIARNTLIDYYRISAKELDIQKETVSRIKTDEESSLCLDDDVVKNEELKILQSCVAQLSPQEKEVISLKFGGEMTNRQIAKMLGISESNVGTIAFRTVRKLRDKFREQAV